MFCLSIYFLSPQIAQIHTDFNFPDRRIKRQIRTIRSEKQASPHRVVAHQFQLYLISHLCNAVMNALPETPCNIILGRFLARIRKYFLRIIIFHHIAHIEEGCLVTDTRGLLHVVGDNNNLSSYLFLITSGFPGVADATAAY